MNLIKINTKGFTLIEVLVSLAITALFVVGIYNLILFSLKVTNDNKLRLSALTIADQKLELIRNLPYDSVGTTAGIVHGVVPDNQTLSHNNGTFYINTLIKYIDDPFDGVASGTPNDLLANDYKQVRIQVSWVGPFGQKNVITFTNIAPQGIETNLGGGTLSINVINALGQAVSGATVSIRNASVTPTIDFSAETGANGNLTFPGAPTSTEKYQITVTKAGYSTCSTTARTVANPNPTYVNLSILIGKKTDVSYAIDILSNLTIRTIQAALPDNWQVNTDTSVEDQVNAKMDIDNNGYIYIVWQDYRGGSSSRIYAQKYSSTTSLPMWGEDVIISTAMNQIIPDVKVDNNGHLYVAWNDNSNGNEDSFLVKRNSSDGSDAWSGAKKINTQADSDDQTHPRIALSRVASPQNIAVVWQDDRNTENDVYLKIYDSSKNEIFTPEVKINSNSGTDGTEQYEPVLAVNSSDNIFMAWTDERSGNKDVYAQKYNMSGSSLWASDIRIGEASASTSAQYSPAIAIDTNDYIYAAWTDERNGNPDVYIQKYNATGTPQWANDLQVGTTSASSSAQSSPSIAVDSMNNFYVAWTDERNGNQDVYAQKFDADGVPLWPGEIRVNVNTSTTAQYNPALAINPVNDDPYATWQDDRNGDADIFATKIGTYGSASDLANIPLTVTGAKKIGENPIIYKFTKNYTSNSSGVADLTNIEWDSYSIITQTGYTAHHIIMTDPQTPISINPNTSREILIYLD